MTVPAWNDPSLKAGTMVRTALWLVQVVGIGNVFTKGLHRDAFEGIAQADRRLRDLRAYGWVFHTSREDVTLRPDEQRFVKMGDEVWQADSRAATRGVEVSSKQRRAALSASGYLCVSCGIAGGELYHDVRNQAAVLSVSRYGYVQPDGSVASMMVPECGRCRAGSTHLQTLVTSLLVRSRGLTGAEQAELRNWLEVGPVDAAERVRMSLLVLPPAVRRLIAELL
jgi:hypothetical protein